MMVWKMIFLFQGCILRFHVNPPGCTQSFFFKEAIFSEPAKKVSEVSPKTQPVWRQIQQGIYTVLQSAVHQVHPVVE